MGPTDGTPEGDGAAGPPPPIHPAFSAALAAAAEGPVGQQRAVQDAARAALSAVAGGGPAAASGDAVAPASPLKHTAPWVDSAPMPTPVVPSPSPGFRAPGVQHTSSTGSPIHMLMPGSMTLGEGPPRKPAWQLEFERSPQFVPGGGAGPGAAAAGEMLLRGSPGYFARAAVSPVPSPLRGSPRSAGRGRVFMSNNESATPKKKHCNCKNSRCLKLYCECFASGTYCDGCNCVNCCNNVENESVRQEAVEATLERNPNAFRPKIAASPAGREDDGLSSKHNKGCHCKKSGCLKKYCECFQAGILCSDNCKCVDCKNFEGSEARAAILPIGARVDSSAPGGGLASPSPPSNKKPRVAPGPGERIAGMTGGGGADSAGRAPPAGGAEEAPGLAGPEPADAGAPAFQKHARLLGHHPPGAAAPGVGHRGDQAGVAGDIGGAAAARGAREGALAGVVKRGVVEQLCEILVLVTNEEAARHEAEAGGEDEQVGAGAATALPPGGAGDAVGTTLTRAPAAPRPLGPSGKASQAASAQGQGGARRPPSASAEISLLCDEEDALNAPTSPAAQAGGGGVPVPPSARYAAQERAALQEFAACLKKIVDVGGWRKGGGGVAGGAQ